MSQLKDWQSGTSNDPYVVGSSGSLTLNQGTANGVAYLNGSKVVTSGSALTFEVDTLRNTQSSGTNSYFRPKSGTVDVIVGAATTGLSTGAVFGTFSNDSVVFYQNSAEGMRLNSTGLGIGTSSPSYKLDVDSGATALMTRFNSTNANGGYILGQSSGTAVWDLGTAKQALNVGGSTDFGINVRSGFLSLGTGNTERMRLDSSGNLGLGVTPSAWGASKYAMQLGARASLYGASNLTVVGNNYYDNGTNNIYIATAAATDYYQSAGAHVWRNAPSGTAGNAITFTQALTLDANGRWLLGTTTGVGQDFVSIRFNSGGSYPQGMNMVDSNASANGASFIVFRKSNDSGIGSISRVGTTDAVAYNTSSDYRLKNITGPVTTSGDYIDRLNPVEGTWKSDGSTFVGLIAHEVQEASRTQVATGTKDGAEMQSMDYSSSELIANLIAEVKSLRQRVATLEEK
jgi:hypothetical protein